MSEHRYFWSNALIVLSLLAGTAAALMVIVPLATSPARVAELDFNSRASRMERGAGVSPGPAAMASRPAPLDPNGNRIWRLR